MTTDQRNRLRLGYAEWLTVLGLIGAITAWAQATHNRLSVIETVVNTEVPRITRTLESLHNDMAVVTRIEQHSRDIDRRIEWLERSEQ